MAWIPATSFKPPIDQDYDGIAGCHFSEQVLFTDGARYYVGRTAQYDDDGDGPQPLRWETDGRDGYIVKHVTHWIPLPGIPCS